MHARAQRDPRLSSLAWRDLVCISRTRRTLELLLPLPWLTGSLLLVHTAFWPLAPLLSFYFFLSGLRLVHDLFHRTLGLPRRAMDALLALLSILMLGSMHAVRVNHLDHHRRCLGDDDVEGAWARQPAWRAILAGPLFPIRAHTNAWKLAARSDRAWIAVEVLSNLALLLVALAIPERLWLCYHIAAMALGQCLAGFFCVWTVHHHCDGESRIARTVRNRLRSLVTFEMLYHVEHHLFPAVPTCNLPQLAARLDTVAPDYQELRAL